MFCIHSLFVPVGDKLTLLFMLHCHILVYTHTDTHTHTRSSITKGARPCAPDENVCGQCFRSRVRIPAMPQSSVTRSQESKTVVLSGWDGRHTLSPLSITVTLTNHGHLCPEAWGKGQNTQSLECVRLPCDIAWPAVRKDAVSGFTCLFFYYTYVWKRRAILNMSPQYM